MRFYPLDKLFNLQDGYCQRFKIDHLHLLLVQQDNERYLIEADCPHRGHPLDTATIAAGSVCCPLHQYCFSLSDGQLLSYTEEACRRLRTWPVTYEGNEIGVMLDDEFGD